jgi:hypothetical protein
MVNLINLILSNVSQSASKYIWVKNRSQKEYYVDKIECLFNSLSYNFCLVGLLDVNLTTLNFLVFLWKRAKLSKTKNWSCSSLGNQKKRGQSHCLRWNSLSLSNENGLVYWYFNSKAHHQALESGRRLWMFCEKPFWDL